MSLYAAIDLHSSNSVLAIMDADGKPVLQRRRPNELSRILADFAPYQREIAGVAVEQTAAHQAGRVAALEAANGQTGKTPPQGCTLITRHRSCRALKPR